MPKDTPLQSLLTVDSASCQVKASLGMGVTGTFNEDPGVCAVHNHSITVKNVEQRAVGGQGTADALSAPLGG